MTLLSKSGFDDAQRHELVYNWTNGRTQSTKDLSEFELSQIIHRIESTIDFGKEITIEMEDEKRRKRSIVLAIATRVGIFQNGNWDDFNRFMEKSSVLHKPLYKYTNSELDKLIKQFRSIEYNYHKSAQKVTTKAHKHKYGLFISDN